MSNQQTYEATDMEYGSESFRSGDRARSEKRQTPTMGRKRGKTPQSFNGIHRRRRRKMAW